MPEIGVGFNTPGIIRFPFENLTYKYKDVTLIRMNLHHPNGFPENVQKTISFSEELSMLFNELRVSSALLQD